MNAHFPKKVIDLLIDASGAAQKAQQWSVRPLGETESEQILSVIGFISTAQHKLDEARKMLEAMQPSPERIAKLGKSEIFVFGSNLAGRHGKGAALQAKKLFGAVNGVGAGRQGQCYAIPTKGRNLEVLPLSHIEAHVDMFRVYAKFRHDLIFLVTEIGCGLAGYTPEQVAPLFRNMPENVRLPKRFIEVLEKLP